METLKKAIEISATIDEKKRLVLDEPLSIEGPARVRVIILLPDDSDINEKEWLRSASINSAFSFLNDPEEDIYTADDGKPYHDQG